MSNMAMLGAIVKAKTMPRNSSLGFRLRPGKLTVGLNVDSRDGLSYIDAQWYDFTPPFTI